MPHFSLDYSANLDALVDIDALCQLIHLTVLKTGFFEAGAIRVRAHRCDHYAIADRLAENAFLDMQFRIGTGRSTADKRAVGDAIMTAVSTRLSALLARPHFALSLEIREIDPDLSWKLNSIHPRLRSNAQ